MNEATLFFEFHAEDWTVYHTTFLQNVVGNGKCRERVLLTILVQLLRQESDEVFFFHHKTGRGIIVAFKQEAKT